MTEKPIFIGIAGDSASGKHTFFSFIHDVLGKDNVALVNGDDYHKWPRRHPMWEELTHLHPDGNDLELLLKHARSLADGKTVSKLIYDHDKGDFIAREKISPQRFIAFVGLHALYLEEMRGLMDVGLYMSPREDLRRYWKIRRDQFRGGYTEKEILRSIERRLPDGEKYVDPQKGHADLVVHYYSPQPVTHEREDEEIELRVKFFQKGVTGMTPLLSRLSDCAELKVACETIPNPGEQRLDISGSLPVEEVERIANESFVPYLPATSEKRKWRASTQGICQLVFLHHLCRLNPFHPPEGDRAVISGKKQK